MSELTIRWGEVVFENLAPFGEFFGPPGAGMFAVMAQTNPKSNPSDFRILFFGEAEDLSSAEFFRNHPKFRCCISEAEKLESMFFAVFPLPDSTAEQRKNIQRLLAEEFRPICNW